VSRKDKKGRSIHEHGTYIQRSLLSSEAWRALPPKAQMTYIWLRLEWKGPQFNNNGKIRLSYRQAAQRVGISTNAAMGGFHELQAKDFIIVTKLGAPGVEGEARGPTYELTDIGLPGKQPKRLFLKWNQDQECEVVRHRKPREVQQG